MTGTSYAPGSWLGIVRSRTAVILGPDTPPALAEAVWNLLAGKPEVYEVLQAITGSAGGNLSRIPPFAILDFTGSLRVFLRGGLELTVETPDGPVDLHGRDVTTWSERSFAAPGASTLAIPGAGPAEQPQLRLGEGMVLLQSLRLAADAGQGVLEPPAPAAEGSAAAPGTGAAGGPLAASVPPAVADAAGHAGASGYPAATVLPTAVAVDSEGSAEVIREPEPVQEHAPAPETTIAPGHGDVSVETVYAVLDDDGDYAGLPASEQDVPAADWAGAGSSAAGADTPDAPAPAMDTPAGSNPAAAPPADQGSAGHALLDQALLDSGRLDSGRLDTDPLGTDPVDQSAADLAPALDQTSSYDHLWERTVMRNIEDAAVREDPSDEEHAPALGSAPRPAALGSTPDAGPDGPAEGAGQEAGAGQESTGRDDTGQDEAGQEPGAGQEPRAAQPPAAADQPKPATGLLIESVPWRTGGAANPPAQPASPPSPPQLQRPPQPAPAWGAPAASPAQVPAEAGPPAAGFDEDHDGQTVMKGSLAGAGASHGPAGGPGTGDPAASGPAAAARHTGGPLVLARVCPQGHANPPIRSACTLCGAPLPQDAVQVGRPNLGRMRLSTGELLDLDQSLVIGRQPSVSRVQGGVMPRLVQVPSPAGDISRSHVEVRLEGWHVMLCDLKATNGTVLVREGQPPRRLAQNEMAILLDGDIAELGDNISLRFEEIP